MYSPFARCYSGSISVFLSIDFLQNAHFVWAGMCLAYVAMGARVKSDASKVSQTCVVWILAGNVRHRDNADVMSYSRNDATCTRLSLLFLVGTLCLSDVNSIE